MIVQTGRVLVIKMLEMLILDVHNSWSSHADNLKNKYLILGLHQNFGINGNFGLPQKKFGINLLKQIQHFAWLYIIMVIIVILLLMQEKWLNLNPTIKILTFRLDFV